MIYEQEVYHGKDKMETDNSELYLTDTVQWPDQLSVPANVACLSVYYSQDTSLLFAGFQNGVAVAGRVEKGKAKSGFKVFDPTVAEQSYSDIYKSWSRNGQTLVGFKDIGLSSDKKFAYFLAMNRQLNQDFSMSVVIRIRDN